MASESLLLVIEENLGELPATLIYAFLELVMIFLMFLDGLISFAATEFAQFFGLKVPCLICNRIDHALCGRDPDFFYKESICHSHRIEILSLGYCHSHMNLSHVHQMCKNCLLSFVTEKKSSVETYRFLVAVLGSKTDISFDQDHKIHLKFPDNREEIQQLDEIKKRNRGFCSCCQVPMAMPPDAFQLPDIQVPSITVDGESLMPKKNGTHRPYSTFFDQRVLPDIESDIIQEDHSSPILKIGSDVDDVMRKKKRMESLDGSVSEFLVQQGAAEKGIWSGLDGTDGNLKRGFEVLDWDYDSFPNLYGCDLLHRVDNGKEAAAAEDGCNGEEKPHSAESKDTNQIEMVDAMGRVSEAAPVDSSYKDFSADNPLINRNMHFATRCRALESKGCNTDNREPWKFMLLHLQRRALFDRKQLVSLSAELDKERNASAVAANEAMAMITRLQEEKSAVLMEALHYHRLMEEQADHNQEALETMRDVLSKKEAEIRALEAELEVYRERFDFTVEMIKDPEDDAFAEPIWEDTEDFNEMSDANDGS